LGFDRVGWEIVQDESQTLRKVATDTMVFENGALGLDEGDIFTIANCRVNPDFRLRPVWQIRRSSY
jgi:hypothetical protein